MVPSVGKLYDLDFFKKMKKTSIFVNTGRGSVVDQEALGLALREGWILGAALDVVEKEPMEEGDALYGEEVMERLLLTCHSMDKSEDYMLKLEELVRENLIRFIKDKPMLGKVNKKLGY